MDSLVARTAHSVSRSCSSVLAEICRSVGGSISSSVLHYNSYAEEAFDGRVLSSGKACSTAHLLVRSPYLGKILPSVPQTQTFEAARRVCPDRNAYPPRKWERFRVRVPIASLKPQQSRTALNGEDSPVGNCFRAFSFVAQESYHVAPRPGSVLGKELPIDSACGGGNIHVSKAIAILKHRQQQGIVIDSFTFVEILKQCSNQRNLFAARQVYDCIIQSGMDRNPYVTNTLLNVYVRCGKLEDARRVFDGLEKKTAVTWNIMIGGYARNGRAQDAIEIFDQMRQRGGQPGRPLCLSVLSACASPLALEWGKEVHAYIRHAGLETDPRIGTALVHMYAQCGCIVESRRVFEGLTNRDVITWNAMIGAYAKGGFGVEAYRMFLQMQREGFIPDAYTYANILNSSASEGALGWVTQVHRHALEAGLESDLRVGSALAHMYAKCGNIDSARVVFDRMEHRDGTAWTIMIGAYAESGCGEEAYRLFLQMKQGGFKPNAITYASILNTSASVGALEWVKEVHRHALEAELESDLRVGNALVHMYAKCGSIDDARLVFDRLKVRDVRTWTAIIGAYAESGCGAQAYRLFLQMQREGFEPDGYTYASILNPSASAGALEWVKEVHAHALDAGLESDLRVATAFVHMYAKSGNIDDARQIFDRLEDRDVIAWTTMIGGLAHHGCGREALELFRSMNVAGVKPNESSFVAVLSACCHAGLVDDGHRLFLAMTQEYGIKPTVVHYNCMVDLLGRAGHLEEAKHFIDDMSVEPNGVTWKALLGACRTYGNVDLGELAAKEALKLEPKDASAYVLLSNIYAAAGQWEKVWSVRKMMQNRGVRKEAGRSWIEVENKIHEFVVGDTSHPEAKAIYALLNELTEKMKAEGYVPDTKLVLQNIDEEDKKLALCSHSEKLAIAYGLLRIRDGYPIRIYKNLRVCSDCHTATKFISKVTGREIIARDANRFHHIKDGVCSCGDYW